MTGAVLFNEQYGSSSLKKDYVCTESGSVKILESQNSRETFQSVGHTFRVGIK